MKDYFFNFFSWWYFVVCNMFFFENVYLFFLNSLHRTRVIGMVKSFFVPLYQDYSGFGLFLGVFLRFWWIVFGLFYCTIITLPILVVSIFLYFLPFFPILIFIYLL